MPINTRTIRDGIDATAKSRYELWKLWRMSDSFSDEDRVLILGAYRNLTLALQSLHILAGRPERAFPLSVDIEKASA